MKLRKRVILAASLAAAISSGSSVLAAETITYTYDAQGRLVKVERSGTVNNGATTTYSYDKADNRTAMVVTGAAQTLH